MKQKSNTAPIPFFVNAGTAAVAAPVKVSKKDRSHWIRAGREQLSGRDFFEIFTLELIKSVY